MNNSIPLVSIAILSYNQEDFIREAVLSACNQSYCNVEVIVSDDGSNDSTLDILKELLKNYPDKLKIVSDGVNLGITNNCNRALSHCSGDFIVFMGGDDVLFEQKVEMQVEWFQQSNKRVLCGHLIEIINKESEVTGPYKSIKKSGVGCAGWIRRGVYFGALSIMIRASAIPKNGFDKRIPHASDWKFYMDCIGETGEFGFVDSVLGQYRKHDNNITSKTDVVMSDVAKTLDILGKESKGYIKHIKYARNFLCIYGEGVLAEGNGDVEKARSYYIQAIRKNPFLTKAYIRLLNSYIR